MKHTRYMVSTEVLYTCYYLMYAPGIHVCVCVCVCVHVCIHNYYTAWNRY